MSVEQTHFWSIGFGQVQDKQAKRHQSVHLLIECGTNTFGSMKLGWPGTGQMSLIALGFLRSRVQGKHTLAEDVEGFS